MDAAARAVAALNRELAAGGRAAAFLSANFVATHFADDRLAGLLDGLLADTGLAPGLLKIDQSFTRRIAEDRRAAEIVRSGVELGRQLDIGAIAEGIETAEQAGLLAGMGVVYGQGYLFGRPSPAPDACAAFLGG